jgi:hypothetical protein
LGEKILEGEEKKRKLRNKKGGKTKNTNEVEIKELNNAKGQKSWGGEGHGFPTGV